MDTHSNNNICPKCQSSQHLISKLFLIGKQSPDDDFCGRRADQLAIDECRKDALKPNPLEQFVEGCYCRSCGIGFIPDEKLK